MHVFATPYTIHFDDTMAYGSHHFLTAFKLQCAGREALLFGEHVYDREGAREALDEIHLLTADAYARNLGPARLGQRLAIFVSFEARGHVSLRFCFRVLDETGRPVCAGFQTVICARPDAEAPSAFPAALLASMDALAALDEGEEEPSFRERVLAGGRATASLFGPELRALARRYLSDRQPRSQVVATQSELATEPRASEAWLFSGQGSFDPVLLSERVQACVGDLGPHLREAAERATLGLGGDAEGLLSGELERCVASVRACPALDQVGMFVQNVLGAHLRARAGHQPTLIVGHSFGELAAMCVAGCYALEVGVEIVCARTRAVLEHGPRDAGMLAVFDSRVRVEIELARHGDAQLVIAGRVHPGQTVVSGPRESLTGLATQLERGGTRAIQLATPTSFHHPSLQAAAVAWHAALREIPLSPPEHPVYSPIGRHRLERGEDLPALISSQLCRSFDLQGAIEDVVGAGLTRLVDCGSTGALQRMLREIVPETMDVSRVGEGPDAPRSGDDDDPPRRAARREPVSVPEPVAKPAAKPAATTTRPAVAIVAAGCLLPGGARDPAALWGALARGHSGIVDLRDRDPDWADDFYAEEATPDRSSSALSGVVDDADLICPAGVDPERFVHFSRTQKLLAVALAPCRDALPNHGATITCLVGATADGFEDQDAALSLLAAGLDLDVALDPRVAQGPAARVGPHEAVQAVVEHVLGPGIVTTLIDAACASSLYTIALGMRALETGAADLVLAGGVFCPGPGNSCLFSQFKGLTADASRPFAADANGVVFSEGAAFVALRRRSDAQRAGQTIHAIVRGVGLSSDGRSPSANVPQTRGQILALERCYTGYGLDPATVEMIEAHGTATPVGDATELRTMHGFFAGRHPGPIHVHSLKGLLGHAGWAAGAASVIAACESLRRAELPAQANHRAPARALTEAQGLLCVSTQAQRLGTKVRRAGVNGFGFGGANAHVLVEGAGAGAQLEGGGSQPEETLAARAELVIVASHGLVPGPKGVPICGPAPDESPAFDRAAVELPAGTLLLPDLVEDMDISQTLALRLVDGTLARVQGMDAALARDTALVVAMAGKTERAVFATGRVLAPRLTRSLSDTDAPAALTAMIGATRASGPYTLQCMMPNVAAGRAASRSDLKGPNFVVDAGRRSLAAALDAAALLLSNEGESGVEMVVVGAIHANAQLPPNERAGGAQPREIAAGFALTTRARAQARGLELVCRLRAVEGEATALARVQPGLDRYGASGADALLEAVELASTGATRRVCFEGGASWELSPPERFPIHTPVWVPSESEGEASSERRHQVDAALILMRADATQISRVLAAASTLAPRICVAVAGPDAAAVVADRADPRLVAIDLREEASALRDLACLDRFRPDLVVALEQGTQELRWTPREALRELVVASEVRELAFLVARREIERLRSGALELWGLCPGAWSGAGEAHPLSGPLSGCLKAIARELPQARLALVSTASADLHEALAALTSERGRTQDEPELAYASGRRFVRRLQATGSERSARARVELDAQAVVVVSGGARGVTAVMAEALLHSHGCTVIALGRSTPTPGPGDPENPEVEREWYAAELARDPSNSMLDLRRAFVAQRARWEAHATLESLRAAGGRVEYLPVDVCDRAAVDAAIEDILRRHGRIDLLVHGAGVQWSKRLEARTLAEFRTTLAVKLTGLHHLVEACATRLGRLVPVHALSSAYSVFGNDGQHDYGAANEGLDRICALASNHAGEPWSSLAWLAWDGIGMTRGSEYRELSVARGLSGVGRAQGQRLFAEVLGGRTRAAINVPLTEAERERYAVRTVARREPQHEVEMGFAGLDCLDYHHVRGQPTLPGAWALERMVAAAAQRLEGDEVTIEDIRFSRFVRVMGAGEPKHRVRIERDEAGLRVQIIGDVIHATGHVLARDLCFCEARISVRTTPTRSRAQVNGSGLRRSVRDPYCRAAAGLVALSGPFDCLRDIEIGTTSRNATFTPAPGELGPGVIPALLIDASWRVSAMYAGPDHDELYVPVEVSRIVAPLHRDPPRDASSTMATGWQIRACAPIVEGIHLRCPRVEVLDQHGAVRMQIEGSLTRRLS